MVEAGEVGEIASTELEWVMADTMEVDITVVVMVATMA